MAFGARPPVARMALKLRKLQAERGAGVRKNGYGVEGEKEWSGRGDAYQDGGELIASFSLAAEERSEGRRRRNVGFVREGKRGKKQREVVVLQDGASWR